MSPEAVSTTNAPDRERVLKALEAGDASALRELMADVHPADTAALLESFDDESRLPFLKALGYEEAAEVIEHVPPETGQELVAMLPTEGQAEVLNDLPDDVLADILRDLKPNVQQRYLSYLPEDQREEERKLLAYPENSAGGWMTASFATVTADLTLREAIETLREVQDETEILSRIFVVDTANRPIGMVRLRDLTFHRRGTFIKNIMDTSLQEISALADQEEAARMIMKYDLIVLPVVNEQRQLVGVISHDDAMEILSEEQTEDIERSAAIAGEVSEETYLNTPVPVHIRRRFAWILTLALLAIISGYVIYSYENVLDNVFILAIYMPMVVAAGGNTGGQSATMVIRAMSLGELGAKSALRVLWKELRIGLVIGTLVGIVIAIQIKFFLLPGTTVPAAYSLGTIAIMVGIALAVQITASTLLGAALPMLARAAKLDPAVVASPAITTLVDVTGLVIYFGLAQSVLDV